MQEATANGKHGPQGPTEKAPANGGGSEVASASQPPAEPAKEEPDINRELADFLRRIDALSGTLPLLMFLLTGMESTAGQKLNFFLRAKGKPTGSKPGTDAETFSIPPEHLTEHARRMAEVGKAAAARDILPQTVLVAMVSQFDAFLSRLLRCLYLKRPELLNDSDKQMSYGEVIGFDSIDTAKEFILEKEIEGVIRKSHAEQFVWMENKFRLKLREDLPIWPVFIELTERRNLFAHCNGVVSSQYIQVCKQHRVGEGKLPAVGDSLGANSTYIKRSYSCLYEMGTKLACVLWRKVFPEELKEADNALNDVIFQLLSSDQFPLAITLGRFAVDVLKKWGSDELRLYLKLNLAQAYKWNGAKDKCADIVEKEDWSARGNQIQLAVALLSDNYVEAVRLMKRIGTSGEVKEHHYKEWPIFREFRKRPEFLDAYQVIYGRPFAPVEQIVTKTNAPPPDAWRVEFAYEGAGKSAEDNGDNYSI